MTVHRMQAYKILGETYRFVYHAQGEYWATIDGVMKYFEEEAMGVWVANLDDAQVSAETQAASPDGALQALMSVLIRNFDYTYIPKKQRRLRI